MAREALPRGPVTFAEEQTAQLIGAVVETNRLLGLLLAQGQVAPGPAAAAPAPADAVATIESTVAALVQPTEAGAAALEELGIYPPGTKDEQAAPPPDREVKRHDRPGAAPAERARPRRRTDVE